MSSFWFSRNLFHHRDRQARTGDTVLVSKSREMTGGPTHWVGGGGSVELCWRPYSEFNTLFLTRFRTYTKLLHHPKQKSRRGRGPQTDKHLPQSPFTGQFFQITTFGIALYQSNLSTKLPLHAEQVAFLVGCENPLFQRFRRQHAARIFWFFSFFYVRYSTLLHLPPLRFHSVEGYWDRTQDSCDYGIDCQTR